MDLQPFGRGHAEDLAADYGMPPAVVLPIREQVSERGDGGRPVVLGGHGADSQVEALFMHLASSVVQQLTRLELAGDAAPLVDYDSDLKVVTVWPTSGAPIRWSIQDLRDVCRSARQPPPVKPSTRPLSITPKGRYAVEIPWSDGHTSIYPYSLLLKGPVDTEKAGRA